MKSRVRSLERLADVYGMVERMRSVELRVASDAVREVADASAVETKKSQEQTARGWAALRKGDRDDWLVSDAQSELALTRRERIERLRAAREEQREQALDAYRASRMRMEQMQQVARRVREQEETRERRKTQAELDDSHLARLLWSQAEVSAGEKKPVESAQIRTPKGSVKPA